MPPITRTDIEAAYARIGDRVRRTPVLALPDGLPGYRAPLALKLEALQHTGSFKARGAFNSLLSAPNASRGVSAASGGNHGAAVAYAARELGIPARIFVPSISSPAKIALIRRYGADVVIGGERYADAQAACDAEAALSDTLVIHPFAAATTIAGQGTIALEWDEQDPAIDTVLVAVGGGGLVAGMAAWWSQGPDGRRVRVVGVEPEGSRALQAALAAGRPVDVPVASIAADSLGAANVGDLVFEIAQRAVDHVCLVSDDAITAAQRILWAEIRLAAEPGGATALAAVLSGAYRPAAGERVGVLLCGANLDGRALSALTE